MTDLAALAEHVRKNLRGHYAHLAPGAEQKIVDAIVAETRRGIGDWWPDSPETHGLALAIEKTDPQLFRVPPSPEQLTRHLVQKRGLTNDPQAVVALAREVQALSPDERVTWLGEDTIAAEEPSAQEPAGKIDTRPVEVRVRDHAANFADLPPSERLSIARRVSSPEAARDPNERTRGADAVAAAQRAAGDRVLSPAERLEIARRETK
jgi:hypothetical protein